MMKKQKEGRVKVMLAVAFSVVFLSSCATLSKNECLHADWHLIGYEDGMKGHSHERIGDHRRACADYGVAPDLNSYTQGYDEGLVAFCTPRNGYQKGQKGYLYTGICPAAMERDFLVGYEAGRDIYHVKSDLDKFNSDVQTREERLLSLDETLLARERILFSDSVPEKKRRIIYERIGELKEERGAIEWEIEHLYREIDDAEEHLHDLRNQYRQYQ